jgi:hypothetical protein
METKSVSTDEHDPETTTVAEKQDTDIEIEKPIANLKVARREKHKNLDKDRRKARDAKNSRRTGLR